MKEDTTFDIFSSYVLAEGEDSLSELLDEWAEQVVESEDYGFERGLLGLGWLIAFLIDKEFMSGDPDEILEDIDDAIYKLAIKEILEKDTSVDKVLDFITYYQQRLVNKAPTAHFYRRFVHFESMKLLLEKLNAFLLEGTVSNATISDKVEIVVKYSFLTKTCVSESLVEEAFYTTIEKVLDFLEEAENLDVHTLDIAKLLLCVQQYDNPHWVSRLSKLLNGRRETVNVNPISEIDCWSNLVHNFDRDNLTLPFELDCWAGAEGKKLLFTLFTNVKSFEIVKYGEKASVLI
ncbi:hypothetical protein [Sphingobacterium lumbrici]|uniref:hypothetical protein n=1 Tax=Sphingobacterium lumbrici TaxID=2559600 RepID=UPI00112D03F2|nr:hypothetical protein [Sphingobacterium lumbrici]